MKTPSRLIDYGIWALLAGGLLFLVLRPGSGPEEGTLAAPINLPLVGESGRFELAAARGKPVVLEIFASWCGACERSTPTLARAYEAHHDRVAFVGVSLDDTSADALRAKSSWGIPFPVALDDGSVSRDYQVTRFPTFVVIGGDGVIRKVSSGAPSASELERWLSD